jgi:Short C-terminal domain
MPGLLRGVARTAVVAGTATAVSNRVSRRQARRWGGEDPYAQQQAYAEPAPAPAAVEAGPDPVTQLRELAKLRDDGILTDEEFAAEKRKILG